jgi:putative membrane protein
MTKHAWLALGALALAACGQQTATTETAETPTAQTPAAPAAPTTTAMSNTEFVQAVVNATTFKIQSSELAATHASRQDVKNLATMLVRDHRAAAQRLTTLVPTIGLTMPTAQIDAAKDSKLDALRGQNGHAFDDAYLDAQVEAHQDAVHLFEQYAANSQAGPLHDFANSTLPTLRQHLERAQSLENAT